LKVGDALRHHPPLLLRIPDPCLELHGRGLHLELGEPVPLDWLALVALAVGGRGGAVPPPVGVSLGPSGTGKRDPHVCVWFIETDATGYTRTKCEVAYFEKPRVIACNDCIVTLLNLTAHNRLLHHPVLSVLSVLLLYAARRSGWLSVLQRCLPRRWARPDLRFEWKRWLFSVTLRKGARSQALQLGLYNGLKFMQ
jgi:hypothetical protein